MMPAADGVGSALERQLRNRHATLPDAAFPELHVLDAVRAGTDRGHRRRRRRDVRAGRRGDRRPRRRRHPPRRGARAAARRRCARSRPGPTTSSRRCARRRLPDWPSGWSPPAACRQRPASSRAEALAACAAADRSEVALVDVAVSRARFVGSRAVWRAADVSRAVRRALARPGAVGLSAIAGLLAARARCTSGWRRRRRRRIVLRRAARARPDRDPVGVRRVPGARARRRGWR